MPEERTDLSAYLLHLTRDYRGTAARDNLLNILESRTIEARNPYGIAHKHLDLIGAGSADFKASQKVACFSETPLSNLPGLVDPGIWRRYKFRPYAVAFERSYALDKGCNPVWYMNSFTGFGGFRWLAHNVNDIIDAAVLDEDGDPDLEAWENSAIVRLTPFIEVMGKWTTRYGTTRNKDFTFEREWRYAGDFSFGPQSIAAIITPPGEGPALANDLLERGAISERRIELIEFIELEGPSA